MSGTSDFFHLYEGLDRVGPGCGTDVDWACARAGIGADAHILDAGAGSGGDIAALRVAAPDGVILAVDKHAPFITRLNARFGDDPGVHGEVGDMMQASGGPFDLIWCAGAIYFVGVSQALRGWRASLTADGVVAFSQICRFGNSLPDEVKSMFDDVDMLDRDGIAGEVAAAGYSLLAARTLSDAAWEEYYQPMEARIAALRPQASQAMTQVLDETRSEIALWRKYRGEFGYLQCVVRPE